MRSVREFTILTWRRVTLPRSPEQISGTRARSFLPGAILSSRGDLITAQRAAFLGVNGFDELPVLKNVPVRCAFTGNEVITFGMPSPGQVRDAFGGFLEVSLAAAGCEVHPSARLADIAEEFHTFVTTSTARILIFTGVSSTSGVDMVRQTLYRYWCRVYFESVQVRPGHPALAAKDSRAR